MSFYASGSIDEKVLSEYFPEFFENFKNNGSDVLSYCYRNQNGRMTGCSQKISLG
jgi:hypothetical protein